MRHKFINSNSCISEKIICPQMSSNVQPRLNTHIFKKKAAIFSYSKIYMPCTNLNTTQSYANTHLG